MTSSVEPASCALSASAFATSSALPDLPTCCQKKSDETDTELFDIVLVYTKRQKKHCINVSD